MCWSDELYQRLVAGVMQYHARPTALHKQLDKDQNTVVGSKHCSGIPYVYSLLHSS